MECGRTHFRPSENLGRFLYKMLFPQKVKQNLVGRILGEIKISVQDFVIINTGIRTRLCNLPMENEQADAGRDG